MRLSKFALAAILMFASTVEARASELSGLWVADLTRSDFGVAPRPDQVVLRIFQRGYHLEVTEVSHGPRGTTLVHFEYTSGGSGAATAATSPGVRVKTNLSRAGANLVLTRWVAGETASRIIIVFRRAPDPTPFY
jgi:hypothetical protein